MCVFTTTPVTSFNSRSHTCTCTYGQLFQSPEVTEMNVQNFFLILGA